MKWDEGNVHCSQIVVKGVYKVLWKEKIVFIAYDEGNVHCSLVVVKEGTLWGGVVYNE